MSACYSELWLGVKYPVWTELEAGSPHLKQGLGGLIVLDVFINTWFILLQSRPEVPKQDGVPHHGIVVIVKMLLHQAPYVLLHLETKAG